MTDAQRTTAENIVNTLERQRFTDWNMDGDFAVYTEGRFPLDDPRHRTKEQILEQTVKMFGVTATGTCGS